MAPRAKEGKEADWLYFGWSTAVAGHIEISDDPVCCGARELELEPTEHCDCSCGIEARFGGSMTMDIELPGVTILTVESTSPGASVATQTRAGAHRQRSKTLESFACLNIAQAAPVLTKIAEVPIAFSRIRTMIHLTRRLFALRSS